MRSRLFALLVVATTLAACSGDSASDTTVPSDTPSSTQAVDATTTTSPSTTATTGSGTTSTISDRPLAPDFTLELGDGGQYTLSEGAKPVYLVFWAEW